MNLPPPDRRCDLMQLRPSPHAGHNRFFENEQHDVTDFSRMEINIPEVVEDVTRVPLVSVPMKLLRIKVPAAPSSTVIPSTFPLMTLRWHGCGNCWTGVCGTPSSPRSGATSPPPTPSSHGRLHRASGVKATRGRACRTGGRSSRRMCP